MDHYEQTDDDKYTVGIAASICLVSLPLILLVTRPLVSTIHTPWMPWLLLRFFVILPPSNAFIILYCGAWRLEWSQPKRVLYSILLSCLIFGADLMLLCFLALDGFLAGNCLIRGGG